jgi:hypothetical protein
VGFEIVYGLGAALLMAGLIWGTIRYSSLRRGERKVGDATTDRLYKKSGDPKS